MLTIYAKTRLYSRSAEAVDRMALHNESLETAAARVGIKKRSVERYLLRQQKRGQKRAA